MTDLVADEGVDRSDTEAGTTNREVVVIGAGPAGLTAAFQFHKHGVASTVIEADSIVGGISCTAQRDGWRFDIGGHRFFTKVQPVEDLWHEILPDEDFLMRPRKSRIFYRGVYIEYPVRAANVLKNLGLTEAVLCVASYLSARVRPPKDQTNYEGWLVARFGWRLYRALFKTYTEKLWGVPVSEMPADWAAERVKGLTLGNAIVNVLLPKRNQKGITSLIEEFQYPKYGPGMMWEACRDQVIEQGSKVVMETSVTKIRHTGGRATSVVAEHRGGERSEYPCSEVISSMPISHLLEAMDPPVPAEVKAAAADLRYRDYMIVALTMREELIDFDDNWLYIHDPGVRTMRIQNFGSWSPYMVKEGWNTLGLEYTVWEGDDEWNAEDDWLIERAKSELQQLGLCKAGEIEAGYVVRQAKAYPLYDERYRANVDTLRAWLAEHVANVHPVGRNGMFRYNNQDHSMLTAMLTVENITTGTAHDVWEVNVEEEYHEEATSRVKERAAVGQHGTGRDAPVIRRETIHAFRARVVGNVEGPQVRLDPDQVVSTRSKPSRTAQGAAAERALLADMGVLTDPYAHTMLAPAMAATLSAIRRYPVLARPASLTLAGLAASVLWFDAQVSDALDAGMEQIAVIRAGYDSRAWRFHRDGVAFFELDHEATQQAKARRAPGPGPTYVPADLNTESAAEALRAHGLDASLPTLFIMEGATMYFNEEVVRQQLEELRKSSAAGSRLAAGFYPPHDTGTPRNRRQTTMQRLARVGSGEEFRLTVSPAEAVTLVNASGWEVIEQTSLRDAARTLVGRESGLPVDAVNQHKTLVAAVCDDSQA